jgi:WD40 repeat protein
VTAGAAAGGAGAQPRTEIRVLGTPAIAVDGRDLAAPELRARQARVLITLLVIAGRDGVEREALAAAIWPGDRPRTWEAALSALVSRLRAMFARTAAGSDVLTFDAGAYRFELGARVTADVEEVIAATKEAHEALATGDADTARAKASESLARFRGPVLPGEHSDLVLDARARVAAMQRDAEAVMRNAVVEHDQPQEATGSPSPDVDVDVEVEGTQPPVPATNGVGRVLTGALVVLVVIATAVGAYALRERSRAQRSARDARARSLSVEAVALRATQADLAMLLAVQANRLRDAPETRSALLSVLEEPPGVSRFLHTDAPVTALCAGPSAGTLVTGHANGNVVLWDPEQRDPLVVRASAVASPVRAVALARDGTRAATGTDDGTVRQWNARTGKPLGRAIVYRSPATNAAVGVVTLGYAGDALVVVGRDGTYRRYSSTGGALDAGTMGLPPADANTASLQTIDRSGSVIARAGDAGVALWDVTQSATVRIALPTKPAASLTALAIAPDAAVVATGAANRVEWWSATTAAPVGTPSTFTAAVSAIAFAPNGRTVAVGLANGEVRLVDVERGTAPAATLGGASERVTALAFDATGARVFVGRATGSTAVYGLDDLTFVRRLSRHDGTGRSVAFGGRGLVVGAGSGPATIWATGGTRPARAVAAEHADLVTTRPGTGDIAIAAGGRIVLADAVSPDERELVALPARAGRIVALAFDDTGTRLAFATSEGGVAVLAVDDRYASVPVRLGRGIRSLAFGARGELWIADRRGVRSYDAANGRGLRVVRDPRVGGTAAIAVDPSAGRLALGTPDGVVFVDLDDLTVHGPSIGDRGPVRAVAFAGDGSMFAAAFGAGDVALWDGRTAQPLGAPFGLGRPTALAFAPDGRSLAVLGSDGEAALVATGPATWQRLACTVAGRRLTRTEWEEFVPGTRYRPAC